VATLHHLETLNGRDDVQEMARVVKRGGFVVLWTIIGQSVWRS